MRPSGLSLVVGYGIPGSFRVPRNSPVMGLPSSRGGSALPNHGCRFYGDMDMCALSLVACWYVAVFGRHICGVVACLCKQPA